MKVSCGAILYTFNPKGEFGLLLGLEKNNWLPFKGCNEENETYEQTAIREIYEETAGILKLENIELKHQFQTRKKEYRIGISYGRYSLIEEFSSKIKDNLGDKFKEKEKIKFFKFSGIKDDTSIHHLTMNSILYFWEELNNIMSKTKLFDFTIVKKRRNRRRRRSIKMAETKSEVDDTITRFDALTLVEVN